MSLKQCRLSLIHAVVDFTKLCTVSGFLCCFQTPRGKGQFLLLSEKYEVPKVLLKGCCEKANIHTMLQRRARSNVWTSELPWQQGGRGSFLSQSPKSKKPHTPLVRITLHALSSSIWVPLQSSFSFSSRNTVISDGCTLGPTHKSQINL